jgi:hypothetical protein
LKYLSQAIAAKPIAGLLLIAAPYVGEHAGWQYADSALPRDFAAKLSGLPIVFYHSRDDETVPFGPLALDASQLPHATIRRESRRRPRTGQVTTLQSLAYHERALHALFAPICVPFRCRRTEGRQTSGPLQPIGENAALGARAQQALCKYFRRAIETRRQQPGTDLISSMITAKKTSQRVLNPSIRTRKHNSHPSKKYSGQTLWTRTLISSSDSNFHGLPKACTRSL